jgi:internalin A
VVRRTILLAVACVLTIGLSLCGCGPAGDQVVDFPDPNLEAAVREALNKASGPIYASELAGLVSLSASDRGIQDLSGLEYCTNLSGLSLWGNQISNISPLRNLSTLTELLLCTNQISDISPLAELANLTALLLYTNQIGDISALVENAWLSEGDAVDLYDNLLSPYSINIYIPELEARGVTVYY